MVVMAAKLQLPSMSADYLDESVGAQAGEKTHASQDATPPP